MNPYLNKISRFMSGFMFSIFFVLCGVALLLGVFQKINYFIAFSGTILIFMFMKKFWVRIIQYLETLGTVKSWLLLTGICFIIKYTWVYCVRVNVVGDYEVFLKYANAFVIEKAVFGGRYMALFPHIFGYSKFLSYFISVFGESSQFAQILNVILTVCSGSILFRLCYSWRNLQAAISVYLLWIACPSQTIYNSLILSEPLYTTLILLFFLLVTELSEYVKNTKAPIVVGLLAGIFGGLLIRVINGCRPVSMILIIAVFLWIFCLNIHKIGYRKAYYVFFPFMTMLITIYTITGPMWNAQIEQLIGEEPATIPGYNMLVGFNQESGGLWNQEDSDQLFYYSNQSGVTAQWVQEQLFHDAVARVTSGNIDYFSLLLQKLRSFLGSDDSCVNYSISALPVTWPFSLICNAFFYLSIVLAIVGAFQLWKEKDTSTYLLPVLYVLGLIFAQMLVEVAGRYHYSIIPMLLLIGQAGLVNKGGIYKTKENKKDFIDIQN